MESKTKIFIGVNIIAFITFFLILAINMNNSQNGYDFFNTLAIGGWLIQFYFILKKLSD